MSTTNVKIASKNERTMSGKKTIPKDIFRPIVPKLKG